MSEAAKCLEAVLLRYTNPIVAVSGGVDSITLATYLNRIRPGTRIAHAISPAVPAKATRRVKETASAEGWSLNTIDAGEFSDPRYRANPLNRCYFCKLNLYSAISREIGTGTVLSGTNTDDLQDFRPGLKAAMEKQVAHPFVEAGMDKAAVRSMAAWLGLKDVAILPASPCLASRVQTKIKISAKQLNLIDRVEEHFHEESFKVVRCRVVPKGLHIEVDNVELSAPTVPPPAVLISSVKSAFPELATTKITIGAYKKGAAFVRDDLSDAD